MKSIKPGRGPSMMGGISAICAGIFGIVWTCIAAAMFPPMAIFGILFIVIAVTNAIYNFKNATGENRYSAFDIVDASEERDPLNERFGAKTEDTPSVSDSDTDGKFCPYCGTAVQSDFKFCNSCGKKLP